MTKAEWHPDIDINSTLAKKAIQSEFPALAPIDTIKVIGEGWDNKVFLVNKYLAFRFPQREEAFKLIEQENCILNYLDSRFELAIPNLNYISKYSKYPFHGYPLIKGISAHEAKLSDKQRIDSLTPLAKFLKQLHSIQTEDLKGIGIEPQVFNRAESQRLINMLNERIKKILDKKILDLDLQWLQKQITVAQSITLPKKENRLIHGDLYCRHLLFDQGKLSGIIDWGDTGINHPAIDLSVVFSFYPADCHQAFFNIYGQVEQATLQYAHFIALYILLTLAPYAHETGDTILLSETANSLKKLKNIANYF